MYHAKFLNIYFWVSWFIFFHLKPQSMFIISQSFSALCTSTIVLIPWFPFRYTRFLKKENLSAASDFSFCPSPNLFFVFVFTLCSHDSLGLCNATHVLPYSSLHSAIPQRILHTHTQALCTRKVWTVTTMYCNLCVFFALMRWD